MIQEFGYILIHGFGGDVSEVQALADYLTSNGCQTVCPKLKGHTGKRNDLKGVTYQDWVVSVEDELFKLQKEIDRIVLVGFSMGGLIALNLSLKYQISALITINTPIYFWDIKRIAKNIISDIQKGELKNTQRYLHSSTSLPFEALMNFRIFLDKTKPLLPQIKCPIFVLQGKDDDVVRHQSADYIFNKVASEIKLMKYYDNSGHTMLKSPVAHQAIGDIDSFLKTLL